MKQVGEFHTPWNVTVNAVFRPSTNDWNTAQSSIVEDEYKIASLPDGSGKWAIDVGGHIGSVSLALLSRGFHVITVEPFPENMDMIAESVGLNGWDARWRPVHGAIGDVQGKSVNVHYGDTSTESGAHHQYVGVTAGIYSPRVDGSRFVRTRTVSITGLVEMCDDRAGWVEAPLSPPFSDGTVELLKMDCEGAEWAAFRDVHPANLAKVKRIAAELHPLPGMSDPRSEFTALLHGLFDDVSVQVYGAQTEIPSPTLAYYQLK